MRKIPLKLIRILLALLLVVTIIFTIISICNNNWLGTWQNRTKIRVDYSKIEAALTNFPVLIYISSSSGTNSADLTPVFNELTTDDNRKKIAVTASDGTTQCYVEIESWDTANQQAWLWVKVPTVNFRADTVLYLYYDSAQPDNTSYVGDTGSTPAQNVWDSSFVAVYHFAESGNGTANEFKDSTSNAHHCAGVSADKCPTQQDSRVGKGQYFDGADDIISIPDHADFSSPTTGALTIEYWFSPHTLSWTNENISGYINWFGKADSSGTQNEWVFTLKGANHPDEHGITLYQHAMDGGAGIGAGTFDPWEIDEWYYSVGRLSVSDTMVWIDNWYADDAHLQDNESYSPIEAGNGTADVGIGTWWDGKDELFEGGVDEIRFSNVFRSDSWITASNYSGRDALLYYGDDNTLMQIYEYNNNENSSGTFGGTYWKGQSFTPTTAHTLQQVKLKLYRAAGTGIGNLNIAIKATDESGLPTGADLSTGSMLVTDIVSGAYTETTIRMTDVALTANTKYAIIWYALSMNPGDLAFKMGTPDVYANGGYLVTYDSGSEWTEDATVDAYFEEWGVVP